jgi:hypothetical protein
VVYEFFRLNNLLLSVEMMGRVVRMRRYGLFIVLFFGFLGLSCNKQLPLEKKDDPKGPDFSDARQLTSNIADINPKWSPSGDRIVFERNRNIFSIDVYSGAIFLKVENGRSPCWSPNGVYIGFIRDGEIYRIRDIPDGKEEKISDGAYASGVCGMDWGGLNRIAYFQPGDTAGIGYKLLSFNVENRSFRMLARENIGYSENPSWLPDTAQVLFSTSKMGLCIYDWEVDYFYSIVYWGSPVNPCWYSTTDSTFVMFVEHGTLYRINPDGSDRKMIIESDFYPRSISYCPPRRQIVFSYGGIWIMDFPPKEE